MKVLLIIPAFQYKGHYPSYLSFSDFPSGFGYIAGALKKAGHEVYGCNPNNKPGYKSAKEMITAEIISSIESCKPDLIGLGGLCIDYAFIKDAIKVIRETYPTIPLVLGGNIVTNDAEFIFNDLKPDFAIVGEGEEVMIKLANKLELPDLLDRGEDGVLLDGDRKEYINSFEDIDNLWYWSEE